MVDFTKIHFAEAEHILVTIKGEPSLIFDERDISKLIAEWRGEKEVTFIDRALDLSKQGVQPWKYPKDNKGKNQFTCKACNGSGELEDMGNSISCFHCGGTGVTTPSDNEASGREENGRS